MNVCNMKVKNRKRIAVIGAGRSGLAAIKSCKEQGLDVVCFEKTDSFGGYWKYREDVIDGLASCMKSTVNIYSKEMDSFSDFPPPRDFPNYMHNTMMMEYLDSYADHFELYDHIRYEHEVVKLAVNGENKWSVSYKCLDNKQKVFRQESFDGVVVCAGKRSHPKIPVFNNQDTFKGQILHSKDIKRFLDFDKKNVLIVGFGNSAIDAAVDISIVAKQVYVSTRSGSWIVPKVGITGLPSDIVYLRRSTNFLKSLSQGRFCDYIENAIQSRLDHDLYAIRPEHDILRKHPVVNEDLPDKILTGRIIIKGDVKKFDEKGVFFEGENELFPIDVVIFATGYEMKVPFVDDVLWKSQSELNLYKFVFPISSTLPPLSFIGFVEPLGPPVPVAEAQCRLTAMVFSGKIKLPPTETRCAAVDLTRKGLVEKFVRRTAGPPSVDFIEYMDELMDMIGAKPDIYGLFMKNPLLYWTCFSGPCLSYQYRLQGPNSWNEAGKAILEYKERIKAALKRKSDSDDKEPQRENSRLSFLSFWV